MPNVSTAPTLTQRSTQTVVSGENRVLLDLAAVHNSGAPAPSSTPSAPSTPTPTPPAPNSGRTLTKFQFRMLFTTAERMAIDNVQNSSLPTQVKEAVVTLLKDLEVSGEVDLDLPQVSQGVTFLVSVGLLTSARGQQILANQAPA